MDDIKNLLEEINSLTAEVEKLAKSDMYKAEGEEKEEGAEMEGGEAAPAPEMEGGEAPEMEGGEDKIEDQAEELEDASEEGGESLDEVVKALDDEDLQELMAAVQAEMAARKGGEAAPAPEAPAAPAPEMGKAMDDMKKTMDEMKKSIDSLRAENASLKKSAPVSRPAAMNRAEVQTMAKSDAVPEMLSKSEVVEYLLNTKAPVSLVQDANWASSPAELRDVYTKAELKGVKIPTKK
jgi:hypothetical protein